MGEIRALTLKQPWAFAITHGDKRVENRTWKPPPETRWFAIHAGAHSGWDHEATEHPQMRRVLRNYAEGELPLVFGAIVALAVLDSVHHYNDCAGATGKRCSPWAAGGQFHWVIGRVHVLDEPAHCRGALKLWPIPGELVPAIRAQLLPGGAL